MTLTHMEKAMSDRVPGMTTEVECPILKQKRDVSFKVNVFRGPDHGGLDVSACSEFLENSGQPTCGHDCVHGPTAHGRYEDELRKHREELGKIGPNVIG